MSCAEEIASGLGRPRRNVLATSQNHTQIPYVVVVAPLDDFADKIVLRDVSFVSKLWILDIDNIWFMRLLVLS